MSSTTSKRILWSSGTSPRSPVHRELFIRMKTELDAWMRGVVQSVNGADY